MLTQAERRFSPASIDEVMQRIKAIRTEAAKTAPLLKEGETVNQLARADIKW